MPPLDLLRCDYSRLSKRVVDGYIASGQWNRVRLDDYLRRSEVERPDHVASIDVRGEEVRSYTYREYANLAWRIASGLRNLGVRAGDVVTVMLPNCSEFGATIFATSSLAAVYSGIPVAYGSNEAAHMLNETESRILILSGNQDRRDFVALAGELRARCPALEHVVLLGGEHPPRNAAILDFERLVDTDPLVSPELAVPGVLAHIGFTSGTTSKPKGVLNTHETLDSTMRNWVEHVGGPYLDEDVVSLVASPIGHHAGFVWGVLMTAYLGGTAVHLGRWDAAAAAELIKRHGVTTFLGAPAFMVDLLSDDSNVDTWASLRVLAIAGAPIPRPLVSKARDRFGCFVCPAWGMTELGIGVSANPSSPPERVDLTDGLAVRGCEVRVVDAFGSAVPVGTEGDLQIRGSSLFVGYLHRPDFIRELTSLDGWFDTGDRAFVENDGYLTLTGRTKDLVIRGGENIPVTAVEDVLFGHPAIHEVAIVGVADVRLGERACACIVPTDGHTVDLEAITTFLAEQGVSKHFWPEKLYILAELPHTPSGKVRKVELRRRVAAESPEPRGV